MGGDNLEIERAFVASLHEDTGNDLSGWMAAIGASGNADRNAIIEWLQRHGFTFARASWLERIHHNGGRLIYEDGAVEASTDEPPLRADASAARPQQLRATASDVGELLAPAKGLRPLADLVLKEIAAAAPTTRFEASDPFITASLAQPFAALLAHPKKLRLFADFDATPGFDIRAAETVGKRPAPFAKMLLLDDARRIDAAFRALLSGVAERGR